MTDAVSVAAVVQALSAVVVVCFTWRLVRLSQGMLQANRRSADAAKESAEAATTALQLANRPYVDLRDLRVPNLNTNPERAARPRILYKLFNPSNTPAIVTRVEIESKVGDERTDGTYPMRDFLLSPAKGYDIPIDLGELNPELQAHYERGRLMANIKFTVSYKDPFENEHSQVLSRTCVCGPDGEPPRSFLDVLTGTEDAND